MLAPLIKVWSGIYPWYEIPDAVALAISSVSFNAELIMLILLVKGGVLPVTPYTYKLLKNGWAELMLVVESLVQAILRPEFFCSVPSAGHSVNIV